MAGKTLIGGTSYTIKGGKTLVGGTGYSISKGKTLIGGTEKSVTFSSLPSGALYWLGDECTDITGGWRKAYESNGSSGTFTKNAESIYTLSNGSSYGGCGGATTNLIDLTNYSKICFYITAMSCSYSNYNVDCVVWSSSQNPQGGNDKSYKGAVSVTTATPCTLQADISSLSGSYYVGWLCAWRKVSCTIAKIWLE